MNAINVESNGYNFFVKAFLDEFCSKRYLFLKTNECVDKIRQIVFLYGRLESWVIQHLLDFGHLFECNVIT